VIIPDAALLDVNPLWPAAELARRKELGVFTASTPVGGGVRPRTLVSHLAPCVAVDRCSQGLFPGAPSRLEPGDSSALAARGPNNAIDPEQPKPAATPLYQKLEKAEYGRTNLDELRASNLILMTLISTPPYGWRFR
jgi:hypothetical protein